MMMSVAPLVVILFTGCSGLSIDPTTEVRALGQKDRIITQANVDDIMEQLKDGSSPLAEVSIAEKAAIQARNNADELSQSLDTNMSMRELEAKDKRAQAEFKNVFNKEEKLEHISDTFEKTIGATLQEVEKERRAEDKIENRDVESYNRVMKKLDREEEIALAKEERTRVASEKADHMAQVKETLEDRIAEKDLRQLRKKRASEEAKDRRYQQRRGKIEAEASMRLWDQANELRQTTESGTIPRAEVLRLLDVTEDKLAKMEKQLANLTNNTNVGSWFEERVRGVRFKSAAASGRLLETVLHGVAELKSQHRYLTDHGIVSYIVKFLNQTQLEVKALQEENSAIAMRIEGWSRANPEKLSHALSLALNGVVGNAEFRNHLVFSHHLREVDHSATQEELCNVLTNTFTENIEPAYRSLGRMKERLDKLAKVGPSIMSDLPDAQRITADRTHDFVNMAYTEYLAFQQSATSILKDAVPIILERLHCEFSGSTHVTPGLGYAILVMVVSWLAL